MARDLEAGELDACWGVPAEAFERLRRDQGVLAVAVPGRSSVQLGFTCSERPDDADPALRDPLFRQALNWAVDRRGISATAFDGFAAVGSTMVAPGLRRDPDYHYEPSPDVKYGYDLKKAAALLDEAGYLKIAGRLLDTDREPVELRLYACDAPPQGVRVAKAIAKDLRALGIDLELTVLPEATMRARLSVTVDGLPRPEADLFVSDWVGDRDPSFSLSVLTSGQIGSWNETGWSDPEYELLFARQAATVEQSARKVIVDDLQRLAYQQSPYIVVAYPQSLEAVDTSEWLGWVQAPAGTGSAIGSVDNLDSYLYVHRREAPAPVPAEAPWWVWPALPGAMLAGAGSVGAAWLVTRRAARSPWPGRRGAPRRCP
jgi:peptide/nickel transport system substrate-binding protein